jgi:hypothetical protein
MPEIKPPPMGAIFWILVFYVLLVGPVNYYYLKKKDRLLSLFVTVPSIALFFSIILFLMGFSMKGSSILTRNFSIIYSSQGNQAGMVDSVFSIFSPKHLSYNIEMLDSTSAGNEIGNYYSLPGTKVQENEYLTILDQKISMWNLRQYRMQRTIDLKNGIIIDVKPSQNLFTGKIENLTELNLKNCVLYYQGQLSYPFDLPPGKKEIQLNSYPKNLSSIALQNNFMDVFNLNAPEPNDPEAVEIKKIAIKNIADDLLLHNNSIALIGWSENNVNPLRLNHRGQKNLNITLFYVR